MLRLPMLRSPFLRLLIALSLFALLASYLPRWGLTLLFSSSCLIKDLLFWVMPAMVAVFVASALAPFGKRTPLLLLCLALFEALSNGVSTLLALGAGLLAAAPAELPQSPADGLEAWFRLAGLRPAWWSAQLGVAVGVAVGALVAMGPLRLLALPLQRARQLAQEGLARWFLPVVPLFVVGFTADLWVRGVLGMVAGPFVSILFWLLAGLLAYLAFLFGLGARFQPARWWRAWVGCLPSGALAATSMSSVATLPVTLAAAEQNLRNPLLARLLIPATVNIQMPGDCFANVFLALAVMPAFGVPLPSASMLFWFMGGFILSRFAAAGVTGGAILLMLPLYEQYLGFTSEMCSLMIALNLLLDPVITSANVMGNGALAMVFERFFGRYFVQQEGPVWS
jgi:hypothetical protein